METYASTTTASGAPLCKRELEIVTMAAAGMCDKEIAGSLGISFTTVRTYWERIRLKLSASNRTHAVSLAFGIAGQNAGRDLSESA